MSFGGSVLAMIQSLRANARPKHNAFQDWDSQEKLSFLPNQKLRFKKVSKETLYQIKIENSLKIEREQNRKMILKILLLLVLIPLIVFVVFQFFFNSSISTYRPFQPNQIENVETVSTEKINYLLNSGYEWLGKNHYKNARFQFNRVLGIQPQNTTANSGYAASFVYECKQSNTNCEKARMLVKSYLTKFGNDSSIDLLIEMLE